MKHFISLLSISIISSYVYSIFPKGKILIDDFKVRGGGEYQLPNNENPEMSRNLLSPTFRGEESSNPQFNILGTSKTKKIYDILNMKVGDENYCYISDLLCYDGLVDIAKMNPITSMKYKFIDPLPFNKGSYINFHMSAVKSPFKVQIIYRDYWGDGTDKSDVTFIETKFDCVPGQNLYSAKIGTSEFSLMDKVDSLYINFIGLNSAYKGSLGLIDEIRFNESDAVPEPLSLITLGGSVLGLARKKRRK